MKTASTCGFQVSVRLLSLIRMSTTITLFNFWTPTDLCTRRPGEGMVETFDTEIGQSVQRQQCQAFSGFSGSHGSPWSSLLFIYEWIGPPLIVLALPKATESRTSTIHNDLCFLHHIMPFSSMIAAGRVEAECVQMQSVVYTFHDT
ncbi:hypothetical protein ARMSODRAFT_319808 [Armillaria solidipes]|uniref:Uncharacterized protein n=1 Tax=Armillaria solidipes TaxID=1076256 RepID=A0A2H3BUP8_9AGAR|nr:hypothetical protein ARMSODRAFT_133040 [Armillaria solidipes]PBK67633.1 hypothetical protein ARMSODRAFT_319808 [Armillaria solidipes]